MVIIEWVRFVGSVDTDSSMLKDEINEGIFKRVNIFELFVIFSDWVMLVVDEFVEDYRLVELV